ncbi:hypothetical protein B566_EDAN016476, partial [Ephemera danica]
MDLIGPMPSFDEAVTQWISCFGCPLKITTDQGLQFEAKLFRALLLLCGAKLLHTTAYHPEANGMKPCRLFSSFAPQSSLALIYQRTSFFTENNCGYQKSSSLPLNCLTPEAHFLHVRLDLIGPMPSFDEAVTQWISCFGCPLKITTDQGLQFEAKLFRALLLLCGAKLLHTTAYHPEANGMKPCRLFSSFAPQSSLALIYQRTSFFTENNCGYQKSSSLPLNCLTVQGRLLLLLYTTPYRRRLATTTHFLLRCEIARSSLEPLYTGTYEVVSRNVKTFKIIINNKAVVVNI